MKKIILLLLCLGIVFIGSVIAEEKKIYNDGTIDYAPSNVSLSLDAVDDDSHVKEIQYSLDWSNIQVYKEPIKFSQEGRHTLAYRAIDISGNAQSEVVYSIIIDDSFPILSGSVEGEFFIENDKAYLRSDTMVFVWAEDEYSGVNAIYSSIDSSGFMRFNGVAKIADEGEHVARVYATDNVGNTSPIYKVRGIVDDTPPVVSITTSMVPAEYEGLFYTVRGNEMKISAVDEYAGVKEILVSIDGSDYFRYTEPFKVQIPGKHTLKVVAVDRLNNKSDALEYSFFIDTKVPEARLDVQLSLD